MWTIYCRSYIIIISIIIKHFPSDQLFILFCSIMCYWVFYVEGWWEKRFRGQGLVYLILFFSQFFSVVIPQQHLLLLCSPLYMYKFYIQPCHVRENWKSLKFILLLLDSFFFLPLLLFRHQFSSIMLLEHEIIMLL